MMFVYIFVAVVVLLLLVIFFLAVLLREGPARQLTPVDLDAFDNLIDPEEDQFLKDNLSSADFQKVQRTRIRAARLYVATMSENAGVQVAVGQSARSNSDPAIAASGQEIFQRAIQLKVWCLFALFRLNTAWFFPTLVSPPSRIAAQSTRPSHGYSLFWLAERTLATLMRVKGMVANRLTTAQLS
jgi:hypothetical protein